MTALMPYTKSPQDIAIEQNDLKHNRTMKHLRNANFYKFSVGDVLVQESYYSNKWNVRMAECGLPYKYVYVFENELGIGYIRRLSVTGEKFVEKPVCVLDFDPASTRFQLDSVYADNILLGDNAPLDLKSDYKEKRNERARIYRANDKIRENTKTVNDVIALFRKLKVGDQFWYGWTRNSIQEEPVLITSIDINNTYPEDSCVRAKQVTGTGYRLNQEYRYVARHSVGQHIFLTQPLFVKEDDALNATT